MVGATKSMDILRNFPVIELKTCSNILVDELIARIYRSYSTNFWETCKICPNKKRILGVWQWGQQQQQNATKKCLIYPIWLCSYSTLEFMAHGMSYLAFVCLLSDKPYLNDTLNTHTMKPNISWSLWNSLRNSLGFPQSVSVRSVW